MWPVRPLLDPHFVGAKCGSSSRAQRGMRLQPQASPARGNVARPPTAQPSGRVCRNLQDVYSDSTGGLRPPDRLASRTARGASYRRLPDQAGRPVPREVFLWSSMASITLTSPPHGVEGASWSLWALVCLRRPAGRAAASWPIASGRTHRLNRRHLLLNLWFRIRLLDRRLRPTPTMTTMAGTPIGSSSRPRAHATGQAGPTSYTRPV
jgi:hypothetical protein